MLTPETLHLLLRDMGIDCDGNAELLILGKDLQMDTLAIKRLRQLIEMHLNVRLPTGFRISRSDTLADISVAVTLACATGDSTPISA
jgi:hypothetical protein